MVLSEPVVEVLAQGVNLRAGPGVSFPVVGSAALERRYPAIGQFADCTWLQIRREDGSLSWITGAPIYTALNVECRRLPAVLIADAAEPPTATAVVQPVRTPAPATPVVASEPTASPIPSVASVESVQGGPLNIAALSPAPDAQVSGGVSFAWQADTSLAPNQVYELVFWNSQQSHLQGRALNAAAASTTMQVNVDNLAPGRYNWGVYLAELAPYSRIRFLGEGGIIVVGGGATNTNDEQDGGSGPDDHSGEK